MPSATLWIAPGLLERADHDEQPDEEEQRRPLDPGERLLERLAADEQHDRRAGQGDRRRLEVQRRVDEEHDDRQDHHRQRAAAARRVLDRAARVELHDPSRAPRARSAAGGGTRGRAAPTTTSSVTTTIGARFMMNSMNDRSGRARDEDVRRVADERRGAADVATRRPR